MTTDARAECILAEVGLEELREQLDANLAALLKARAQRLRYEQDVRTAERRVDLWRATMLVDGRAEGKNEAERKAALLLLETSDVVGANYVQHRDRVLLGLEQAREDVIAAEEQARLTREQLRAAAAVLRLYAGLED
jgi:DNA primase